MNVAQQLAAALRNRRGDQSQSAVASAMRAHGLCWSQSTVSNVEAGGRPVTVPELAGLCSVLRVGLPELLPDLAPTFLRGVPFAGEPVAAPDEIERHAARALSRPPHRRSVTADQVQSAAFQLWGRRMREERDRRLPGSSTRGERGHVTRRLLAELDGAL